MFGNRINIILKSLSGRLWEISFKAVIVIFSMVFYIIQKEFNLTFLSVDPTVSSVMIALLGFSWTQTISNDLHMDRIKTDFNSIDSKLNVLNSAIDLRVFDSFVECREHIRSRIEKATDVRNMCVITCSETDFRLYTSIYQDEIVNVVSSFINNNKGSRWHDVFSNASKGRADLIRASIGRNKNYHSRVLIKDVPIMNFILLKYGKNDSEVFFGFGMHDTAAEDHIFASKNHQIVDTFSRYYDAVLLNNYTKSYS